MNQNETHKIGLGMYTVYESVKADMNAAFMQLAEIGYRGIEFYGEPKDYQVERVQQALRTSGLEMTGWHIEWRNLQEGTLGDTIQYLQAVGCPIAIVPCLGSKWNVGHDSSQECKDRWLFYIEHLNRINELLQKEGILLGYHNHEHEFQLQYDGQSVFDLLFENLDSSVIMELDTGNCTSAGVNPSEILRRYRDRNILLHLKPYSDTKGFDIVLGEAEDANNWQEILHESDVDFQWLLIESENQALPEIKNAELCRKGLEKYI